MSPAQVIDTNVGVVSNGAHAAAGLDCIQACIKALEAARHGVVLIDDGMRILTEYRNHLSASGQPGPGDAFFKWLWDNQGNTARCRQVLISPVGGTGTDFAQYPGDPLLARFDPSDRKFVAVALGSAVAHEILNASDCDWWDFRVPLANNGVNISFLCPDLMAEE